MLTKNFFSSKFCDGLSFKRNSKFLFVMILVMAVSGCDLFSFRVLYKPLIRVESSEVNPGFAAKAPPTRELSVQEFSQQLANKLSQLDPLSAKDPQIVKTFKEKISADFIVDSLIEIWFESSKLTVSQSELESEAQSIIRNFPTDRAFREELAMLQMSYQSWIRGVEIGIKRKTLFKSLRTKIDQISEEELKSYYENNKSKYQQRESLLAKSVLVQDEAQAEVVIKLSKKRKFDELIAEYSKESPMPKDGFYGWVERDVSPDLDQLFINNKSEIIGPIQFNEGYRLFKIVQKRAARQKPFEEVREPVRNEVLALREAAQFSAWLDEQIKKHKIFKNTYAIDSLRVETRD